MKREVHTRSFCSAMQHIAAASAFMACLGMPAGAKLASTEAQKERMVGKAVVVLEKWNRYLNDTYRNKDESKAEIQSLQKTVAKYGNGIFGDMAILNEMTRLHFRAQRGDIKALCAIDEFDGAAEMLCVSDRGRYFCAKALLRSHTERQLDGSLKPMWYSLLVDDFSRASRYGYDAEKSIAGIRRFAKNNDARNVPIDEISCRMRQEYAAYFLARAKSLHALKKNREAFNVALQGIARIPVETKLDSGACNKWRSAEAVLSVYDELFLQPLSKFSGNHHQELIVTACKRYWKHKKLMARLLPRILSPSPDAFGIFRKAGKDAALKNSVVIAAAERVVWEKAGKLDTFKKRFPERFRLAAQRSSQ